MHHFLLFLVFISSGISHSQESLTDVSHERLVNFRSVLVDYEIHNDKLVALTKKNREYFIYFTDTKGSKLFESFEIFFPTDLEIDCMGNLFVVGLDSAFQLNITDFVEKVQSFDLETYQSHIQSCQAYFDSNLVRASVGNSLIYEALDDSLFKIQPVLAVIQVWSGQRDYITELSSNRRVAKKDYSLVDNRRLNIRNDGFSSPYPAKSSNSPTTNRVSSRRAPSNLSAFQRNDSLWVIADEDEILFIYSNAGECTNIAAINGLPFKYRFEQDRTTSEVFSMTTNSSTVNIQKINRNGELESTGTFYKGLTKSDLKISNGYLYFRDSKGIGESIKRVKLN